MRHDVVLIPGDGIGPEVAGATRRMLHASGVDIHWVERQAGIAALDAGAESVLPDDTVQAISEHGIALKPRADVYSLILILTFCAFLVGCIIAGNEAYDHYDVEFWVFEKPKYGETGGEEYAPEPTDPDPAAPAEEVGTDPPPDEGSE